MNLIEAIRKHQKELAVSVKNASAAYGEYNHVMSKIYSEMSENDWHDADNVQKNEFYTGLLNIIITYGSDKSQRMKQLDMFGENYFKPLSEMREIIHNLGLDFD